MGRYSAERDAESEPTIDERILMVKLEERSLQLALAQANLHERGAGHHLVSVHYPYVCSCGWRGRVFPTGEVRG